MKLIAFCLLFSVSSYGQDDSTLQVSLFVDLGGYAPAQEHFERDFGKRSSFALAYGFEIGRFPNLFTSEIVSHQTSHVREGEYYKYDQVIFRLGYCRKATLKENVINVGLCAGPELTSLKTNIGDFVSYGSYVRYGMFGIILIEGRISERFTLFERTVYDYISYEDGDPYTKWGGTHVSLGIRYDIYK